MSVTALIATLNEERNLPSCLASLGFADRIVVVDSGSNDRTVAIAQEHGVEVYQFPGVAVAGCPKRTWFLQNHAVTTDWVLVADADEIFSDELGQEIAAATSTTGSRFAGYYLPFTIFFLGRQIRHASMNTAAQLRLFRTTKGAYEMSPIAWRPDMGDVEVHERILVDGNVGTLQHSVHHDDFKGFANWITKHNRYSTWEAERRLQKGDQEDLGVTLRLLLKPSSVDRRKGLRSVGTRLPFRPLLTFLWYYLLRSGWRDGRAGLVFCSCLAMHQFNIDVKTHELRSQAAV